MTENFATDINYLKAAKTAINNFRSQFKKLSTGLYKEDNEGDQSFDEIWIRDLPDQVLRLLSSIQKAKYYEVDEDMIREVDIKDQKIDNLNKDLMELLLQFMTKINNEDARIDSDETRSARTDRIINRIMDFRKFDQSLDKIMQSINEILPLEEQLSSSHLEAASDSELTTDSRVTTDSEATTSLDNASISTKKSISLDRLDANKKEEDEIKAKIKEAKINARNYIMSDLEEAKNEPDTSKKIASYKDCLARAIEFTDRYFEDATLLEVASAISSDKVAAEIFLYRDGYEPVKLQPASPKLLDRLRSMFSDDSKSDSDVDQRQPEKTLFYKTVVSLDPNSQLVLLSSTSKHDLKKLFLLLELDMGADPKKQLEYQEIKEIVKIVELKQQDQVRKSLDHAMSLKSEARKDALITCLSEARNLADLYDNPAILMEVTIAILEIKQGNLITSDQLLIFKNNPLSKIFEYVGYDSKQELLSKIPDELLYGLLLGPDDRIKGLLEKEVFKRQEQEKRQKLDDMTSKLAEANQKVGLDKIKAMMDYVLDVANYAASYACPQMVFNVLLLINPSEQAAILSAEIDGKTLFHKIIASTANNEHRNIFSVISGDSLRELLPLVNSKLPEDKVIKDLLKAEQVKRNQAEKDKLAAKRQQELEETRKKIVAEEEEKRKQREEEDQLQIKIEQQKQEADRVIRAGFSEIFRVKLGEERWQLAAKSLDLTVDFTNKYGEGHLFNEMLKLVEAFSPSYRRLIYKYGLDVQKSATMFNALLKNGKTQAALELIELLSDDKRAVILIAKDTDGKTIFHKFAELGQLELLTKAIEIIPIDEKSKILNLQDSEGRAALHYAAQRKNGIISSNGKKITSVLLENGGDANICDKKGKTPLHYAAEKGRAKTVNRMLMIQKNSTVTVVDIKDNQGKTALHLAAENNNRTSANILLKNGANPYLMDKNNKTVLEYALEKGRKFFALIAEKARPEYKFNQNQQLEIATAGFFSLFKTAIKSKVPNSVLKFLTKKKKFDLGVSDKDGNNALHLALKNDDEEAVKLLLKHGADMLIDRRNRDGKTARDIARTSENPLIAKIFNKTALTPSENLRDIALKVKSETARENFETDQLVLPVILHDLNKAIILLEAKDKNAKGPENKNRLKENLFGDNMFVLIIYIGQYYPIKKQEFCQLIGLEYSKADDFYIQQENIKKAILDEKNWDKIIGFVKELNENFENNAKEFNIYNKKKEQFAEIAKGIGECDYKDLEFNTDSNSSNIDRSSIIRDFSIEKNGEKTIINYSKIDNLYQEDSKTFYQISIMPEGEITYKKGNDKKMLDLKSGVSISFLDLSQVFLILDHISEQLPEMLKKLHVRDTVLHENKTDYPLPNLHTDNKHTTHHTHGDLAKDLTVEQEASANGKGESIIK